MIRARVTASLLFVAGFGLMATCFLSRPATGQPALYDPATKRTQPAKRQPLPPRTPPKPRPFDSGGVVPPGGNKLDGGFFVRQPRRNANGFAREVPARPTLKIYKLKHATAKHVLELLQRLFHDEAMVADDRTNQILIRTANTTEVDQAIKALDVPGARRAASSPPNSGDGNPIEDDFDKPAVNGSGDPIGIRERR